MKFPGWRFITFDYSPSCLFANTIAERNILDVTAFLLLSSHVGLSGWTISNHVKETNRGFNQKVQNSQYIFIFCPSINIITKVYYAAVFKHLKLACFIISSRVILNISIYMLFSIAKSTTPGIYKILTRSTMPLPLERPEKARSKTKHILNPRRLLILAPSTESHAVIPPFLTRLTGQPPVLPSRQLDTKQAGK